MMFFVLFLITDVPLDFFLFKKNEFYGIFFFSAGQDVSPVWLEECAAMKMF